MAPRFTIRPVVTSGRIATYQWYFRHVDPWSVDVLGFDGCLAAEVYGIVDLLAIANAVAAALRPGSTPLFHPRIVSVTGSVRPSGLNELRTERVGPVPERGELMVPGFMCADPALVADCAAALAPEIDYLTGLVGTQVSAVCGGTFLLAEAGLLNGHAATTSWLFAPELARRYPHIDVQATALIVRDGRFATAGAFSAAHDLALDLIRRHGGERIARATSQVTLIPDTRHSQAPYVEDTLRPVTATTFVDDVQRWLRTHLADRYDLAALAAAFHVSTRTLLRRFASATDSSPLAYLQAVRVTAAKRLLETSDRSIHEITAQVGYSDAATFRRLFVTTTGVTPSEYRRQFRRRLPA
ncbi:AraC family transcriptional regulator [Micromonospora andamanensis]|nr:AraC family transcriptional regulator [Micromonospora andamanensis]